MRTYVICTAERDEYGLRCGMPLWVVRASDEQAALKVYCEHTEYEVEQVTKVPPVPWGDIEHYAFQPPWLTRICILEMNTLEGE